MTLTEIGTDIKSHIEQGEAWFGRVLEEHLPRLLAAAAKYENSPIVQALEGAVLPPETEQAIASLITKFASAYGPAATAAAPPAASPGEPAPSQGETLPAGAAPGTPA